MPPGTISHLAGPLGSLPWKTASLAFDDYCLALTSGTRMRHILPSVGEEVHTLLARQVGGTPDEIALAFALNATEALIKILDCMEGDLGPGHNIITPSTAYASLRLLARSLHKRRGVQIKQPTGTTDAVIAAIDEGTRLILVEQFDTWQCEMLDLARIARVARKAGARLVVDVSQVIGIFPLDYHHFDVAVATAYKGLGGIANGSTPILLNRAQWQDDDLQSGYAGRNSILVESGEDFRFKDDPGDRLQPGGLAWLNIFLLLDSLRNMQHLRLELRDIAQHVLALNNEIIEALANLSKTNDRLALYIIASRNPEMLGPHVSIRMATHRAVTVCERLADRGVYLSYDNTGLRFGPRLYNESADIERAIAPLGEILLDMGYSSIDPSWIAG
jgi:selenocysteine lyase/cysteine desulfurase